MAAAASAKKAQVHAVVGSDEAEIKRAAKELAAQLTPGGDFGEEVIDGMADNADAAITKIHETIQALLTFPFFGGEKFVWLKNVTFLADTPAGRSEGVAEALGKLAETLQGGMPESTRFLISAIDTDRRRSFYKTLTKLAKVAVFDHLDTSRSGWEDAAAALVQELAATHDLHFSADALELFTLFTGGDRRVIGNELEKLSVYLGGGKQEATVEDVRRMVPVSKTGVVFELGNAIATRDLPRALELLDQLLFQGESAIGIFIVAIMPTVRNLLVTKDLMVRHKLQRPQQPFFFGKTLERLPAEATAHLPRKKDGTVNAYGLGIAASHAHRFTDAELRAALDACLSANIQLVTSGMEAKVVLSQLLVRICSPS